MPDPALELSPTRLRYFVAVCDEGSFSGAARTLGVAQPTLSGALRKLEDELGVRLLARTGSGAAPTQAGRELLEDARTALLALDAVRDRGHALASRGGGTVTLAAPPGVSVEPLPRLVSRFLEAQPDALVDVLRTPSSSETLDAVRRGRADLGLVPRLPVPDDMEGMVVGVHELGVALPPGRRLPAGRVRLEDLDGLPFAAGWPGSSTDRLLDEARRRGARPHVLLIAPPVAALPELVARGAVAAFMTTGLEPYLRALGVDFRRLDPPQRFDVRLVHRTLPLAPMARRFVEVVAPADGADR